MSSTPDSHNSPAIPQHPNICVPITAQDVSSLFARAETLAGSFGLLEFRLDSLRLPSEALAPLRSFAAAHPATSLIATCRPVGSGGGFAGTPALELFLLRAAAEAGCQLVDLSLESAEALGPEALPSLRAAGATVLVSFHDFEGPADLRAVLARMQRLRPDIFKLVSTARTLADSLNLLDFIHLTARRGGIPLVAIAMGEFGLITRVLGPRAGAAFTFGAASAEEATAPGQVNARDLVDLFHVPLHNPQTRIFGVAGDPIRSSLSPLMLNTAFAHAGQDAVYVSLQTSSPHDLFRAVRELPLAGCSVTMPLKQTVLPFLSSIDPLAARIGAVNTLVHEGAGQVRGFNTDAAGIVIPLEKRIPLRGARVLVLGAGGAARAAVFGCADRGARVSVSSRTPDSAQALANEATASFLPQEQIAHEDFDVFINATPAGMRGNTTALPLQTERLRAGLVFDLVYNPLDTPLLQLARSQGIPTIPGVEMFVHQGARQFELWTGQPAPVEVMQQAVLHALTQRQSASTS